ncbi:thioredoxin-like protein [Mycena rebaudengoi]|nr:thioredoxin-like protein [Mycena rebaudengoi]
MFSSQLLLALVVVPFASAAIFPKDSQVKMLDAKSWKKAMKTNQTSMVAFVAPWCGHCQRMAPEYSKAALGLHPLLPFYAVDCDEEKNKRLCAEQGVKGFPTVKLFPRGHEIPPMLYESERTASAMYYFATRRIPSSYTKLYKVEEIVPWIEKNVDKTRTLLMTKDKTVPLLWKVLANKYRGQLEFGTHRDRKGKSSVVLGLEAGEKKESKVLIYSPGSTTPFRYEGINKFDSLSKFFDSVIDGTADLTVINEEAKAEEFEPTPEELEIQQQQEAQRIALLHGGFADLVDFEEAVKSGYAEDYHGVHGFGSPPPLKKKTEAKEAPAADEAAEVVPEAAGEQVVFEATPEPEAASPAAASATSSHIGKNDAEL